MHVVDDLSYYNLLPQCYQKVLLELQENLIKAENDKAKLDLLKKFSTNYTMVGEIWMYYYELDRETNDYTNLDREAQKQFIIAEMPGYIYFQELTPARKNFKADPDSFICQKLLWFSLNSLKEKEEILIELLSYPHKKLNCVLEFYEELLGPITENMKQTFMRNKEIYVELEKYFENDAEKYFESVLKIENMDSKIYNIELLLGKKPYAKENWTKFFNFLENSNEQEKLLNAYQRYCGIFLDDKEVANKIIQLKSMQVLPSEEKTNKPNKSEACDYKSIIDNFTFSNISPQILPFRQSLADYILRNIKGNALIKLKKTSKYFFHRLQSLVIYYLKVNNDATNFHKNSLVIDYRSEIFRKLHNISLFHSFSVSGPLKFTPINGKWKGDFHISELISKVSFCDLKVLRFSSNRVNPKDFEFFVNAGNIEFLALNAVLVKEEDGKKDEYETLETIMTQLPKIKRITVMPCHTTPETFEKLLSLSFHSKISEIILTDITNPINIPACVEFLKQNLGPNANVHFTFSNPDFANNEQELSKAMEELIAMWEPKEEKPSICVSLIQYM